MKNNYDAIGAVLVFVVVAVVLNNVPSNTQGTKPRLPTFNIESIIKEFHKMTDAMERVDSLGQLALSSTDPTDFAKNIAAPSLPDISSIADTIGPLINNFVSPK